MIQLNPLKQLNKNTLYKEGDVFVLFGELFGRGYANGLVEEARKRKMKIIGITVGRRDSDRKLHPLNPEQLSEAEKQLGGKIINIPMEAGFDMESSETGQSTVDMLKDVKLDSWQNFKPDETQINICVEKGRKRFSNNLKQVVSQIRDEVKPGNHVHFAHIMAGGVPRSKIILALANRVFKTIGDKYIESSKFWGSGIGTIISKSFDEVTANTFKLLIEETKALRDWVQDNHGQVRYSAYGYHGTEIYFDGKYEWQTYTPYQQGHAKKLLEHHAANARKNGIKATVYNCPEIRTNSSDIFIGVELSLFPLIRALKISGNEKIYELHKQECEIRLKEENKFQEISDMIENYLKSDLMKSFRKFDQWPMENSAELAKLMIHTSEKIVSIHKDPKKLVSDYLSDLVLKATGHIIFNDIADTSEPAAWIGHEVIARSMANTT